MKMAVEVVGLFCSLELLGTMGWLFCNFLLSLTGDFLSHQFHLPSGLVYIVTSLWDFILTLFSYLLYLCSLHEDSVHSACSSMGWGHSMVVFVRLLCCEADILEQEVSHCHIPVAANTFLKTSIGLVMCLPQHLHTFRKIRVFWKWVWKCFQILTEPSSLQGEWLSLCNFWERYVCPTCP